MQEFKVSGMSCPHCEHAITSAIQGLDPKATVTVDRAAGTVSTTSDRASADVIKAIRQEGYEAEAIAS